MIIPFLTQEQFLLKTTLDVLVQLIIMVCMISFARRMPTDYDVKYTRRWRIMTGLFWAIMAVGQLFLSQLDFSKLLYHLSVYGTMAPSQELLSTGLSQYAVLRDSSQHVILGNLTFSQWALNTQISNFLTFLTIGLYCIFFKPSSVKSWVKVRKFLGYIILLFFVPSALDFHYFDVWEIVPALLVIILVYLCVRSYKHDGIAPQAKEFPRAKDGKKIDDFALIAPEEKVDEGIKESKIKVLMQKISQFKFSVKGKIIFLWILTGASFALSIALFLLARYDRGHHDDYMNGYNRHYEEWGVYLHDPGYEHHYWSVGDYKNVDRNLGDPIHQNTTLQYSFVEPHYKYKRCITWLQYGQPMYVRFLNYRAEYNGVNSLYYHLSHDLGYAAKLIQKEEKNQIVYWDKIEDENTWAKYDREKEDYVFNRYNYWIKKHIIEQKEGIVYEFIVYMLDANIYDERIEEIYTVDCPYDKEPIQAETWMIWYYISSILAILALILASAFSLKKHMDSSLNKKAFSLFKYLVGCLCAEYLIILVVMLFYLPLDNGEYDDFLVTLIIFFIYLCLIRIPIMIYVFKHAKTEYNRFYLLPNWLKNSIVGYAETEAPLRAMLVFIIYPLFYLCTFPGGIFVFLYLVPAIIIYVIVFLIIWVIRGATKKNSESFNDLVK